MPRCPGQAMRDVTFVIFRHSASWEPWRYPRTWKTYHLSNGQVCSGCQWRIRKRLPVQNHGYVNDAKGKKMHYMYLEDCWRADSKKGGRHGNFLFRWLLMPIVMMRHDQYVAIQVECKSVGPTSHIITNTALNKSVLSISETSDLKIGEPSVKPRLC